MIYTLTPRFLHNILLRNGSCYEAWLMLWVMAFVMSNEWCMPTRMNTIRMYFSRLILSDLQTREINIKNRTHHEPECIKLWFKKTWFYRRSVSIGWPRSYEPRALSTWATPVLTCSCLNVYWTMTSSFFKAGELEDTGNKHWSCISERRVNRVLPNYTIPMKYAHV